MAIHDNTISPFPADIDRDAFGNWLAGFIDGEGCFNVYLAKAGRLRIGEGRFQQTRRRCTLSISLREDDIEILKLIQSFFGFGTITPRKLRNKRTEKRKPQLEFKIQNQLDLIDCVVFFDKYKLRAKKKNDYDIWRKAVILLVSASLQPFRFDRSIQHRPGLYDSVGKWTRQQAEAFEAYSLSIKIIRKYQDQENRAS